MPVPTEGRLTLNLGIDLKTALDDRARREGRTSTELAKAALLMFLQLPSYRQPDVAALLMSVGSDTSTAFGPDAEPEATAADLANLRTLASELAPLLRLVTTRQEAIEAAIKANHDETLDAIDDLAAAVGRRLGTELAIEQAVSPKNLPPRT